MNFFSAAVALLVIAVEVTYYTGAIACFAIYWRTWRALKRGVAETKLTELQMEFMDVLAEAKDTPIALGLRVAALWPCLAYLVFREKRKGRQQ